VQSFFYEEDATPKLEKLFVSDMENLKEIWPPQFSIEIEQLSSSLRSIEVNKCDSLVKLFSCNPFPLFNNLQELKVKSCGSIQVLFGTDLGRARKIEEQ
nr:NB-ARC domains-containing protein [Tanacetum cinerariifolium]